MSDDPPTDEPAQDRSGEEPPVEIRPYRDGDEDQIFRVLAECHPDSWAHLSVEHWRWKHLECPASEDEDVLVATVGDRIVGCFHGAVLPLRVAPGLEVPCSFDGDFAVLPAYRGRDLTGRAYDISDRRLLDRGVAVRGGFTSESLNEGFYRPRFGYHFVPTPQVQFRKIVGFEALKEKVEGLGDRAVRVGAVRRMLARARLQVDVRVAGFPPASLRTGQGGVELTEGAPEDPDLRVELPYGVLAGWAEGPGTFLGRVLKAAAGGRLKARRVGRCVRRLLFSRSGR